jgi:hypothetical protein
VLLAAVEQGMRAWPVWEQQGLLKLAGDTAAVQLHGSYAAAAEVAVLGEVSRQLQQLLLGLERYSVLDAYWAADADVQQVWCSANCVPCFRMLNIL